MRRFTQNLSSSFFPFDRLDYPVIEFFKTAQLRRAKLARHLSLLRNPGLRSGRKPITLARREGAPKPLLRIAMIQPRGHSNMLQACPLALAWSIPKSAIRHGSSACYPAEIPSLLVQAFVNRSEQRTVFVVATQFPKHHAAQVLLFHVFHLHSQRSRSIEGPEHA